MNSLLKNFKILAENLVEEKGSPLYFLGLFDRTDVERKSDLVISAPWIKKRNSQEDLEFVIEQLKSISKNYHSQIENIVLMTPADDFILYLKRENITSPFVLEEEQRVQIWSDAYVDMTPFHVDFEDHPAELVSFERISFNTEPVSSQDF